MGKQEALKQTDSLADLGKLDLAALKEKLGVTDAGLSSDEAASRLKQYGPNELLEKKQNPLLKFLSFFWGPIAWMIEVAAILSAVVRHWSDFGIILTLLIVNAIVGFWEEFKAGNTIEALKAKLALQARVKRNGKWGMVPSRELVPGDIVRLRIGDIVPADAKLMDGDPIQVDQSALTGESLPVTRASGEAVYSGSIIKQGEVLAVVYGTGVNTYFGKTAQLVESARKESHFQKAVLKIGDYLILIAAALVMLIITVAIFRGDPFLTTLQFALVLLVAAIPVAMPTVLSVTMAVGARILAAKEAIVTRLVAIEEMAGMDILCSDKTGTLTKNQLTLGDVFPVAGFAVNDVLLSAAFSSRAEDQDPIDLAVLSGIKDESMLKNFSVTHFFPFDPVHKRTEADVKAADGKIFKVTKGAPQVILKLAANNGSIRNEVESKIQEFARRGFRALGVARTDASGAWQFQGIIPLYDPPRDDSKATIRTACEMGVRVKMVTGDQLAIAKETARQLGLGTDIMPADELENVGSHQVGQSMDRIEAVDGFAQVYPEHKFHIVDILKRRNHIVGMTGDGVNDAPALKKADAGIAVSGATDAARNAADIVLLSKGLSVIIDAIKESRRIFQRMTSYATYRIAETIRVLLFMTLSILVFNFYPVTAIMIVMLALLNDGSILTIAYDRVKISNSCEAWNMREVLGIASILGVFGVFASFGLFFLGERVFHLDREFIQTLMYLKLSVAGQMTIFLTRTRGPFWSFRPSKILLTAVIINQAVATCIAGFGIFMAPIGFKWAAFVWGYAFAWFFVNDLVKLLAYRILSSNKPPVLSKEPVCGAQEQPSLT